MPKSANSLSAQVLKMTEESAKQNERSEARQERSEARLDGLLQSHLGLAHARANENGPPASASKSARAVPMNTPARAFIATGNQSVSFARGAQDGTVSIACVCADLFSNF